MSVSGNVVAQARSRIGTTLGEKWRLDRLIGVGGMASVYAATHRNKRIAAVKLLHQELSVVQSTRTRFLREGYVANSVDHPGAIAVDDDEVTSDGLAYLVMELLDGESLAQRQDRKGGKLPVSEVIWVADRVLDVLSTAHKQEILHRDIKPENLFLTKGGMIPSVLLGGLVFPEGPRMLKVLDFGVARIRDLADQTGGTESGSLLGTPAFMPPEQARARSAEIDERTDLWAVGATMFHLLTGRHVHIAETANEVLRLAMYKSAPRIRDIDDSVPFALARIIDRALAYERADRWPSAESMREAISEVHVSGALASNALITTPPPSYRGVISSLPAAPPRSAPPPPNESMQPMGSQRPQAPPAPAPPTATLPTGGQLTPTMRASAPPPQFRSYAAVALILLGTTAAGWFARGAIDAPHSASTSIQAAEPEPAATPARPSARPPIEH